MTMTGSAKLAGVMGWPIAHSLSPRLHGYWLQTYGIDGAYLPLAVEPENLAHALSALPKLGFRGVNVTVPHKEAAWPIMDTVDETAQRIGAVNTVCVTPDGALSGTNTDGEGFLANITSQVPDWDPTDGNAVVLGAGGSARAVVAALVTAGCPSVTVVNRTPEKAEDLAGHIGGPVQVQPWSERAHCLDGAALLVNTTTLGLENQPDLDLDLNDLPAEAVVTDLIYAPLETPLLKDAKARGNTVVDGLGMLLHQAVPGFEMWFGQKPEVTDELRQFVLS